MCNYIVFARVFKRTIQIYRMGKANTSFITVLCAMPFLPIKEHIVMVVMQPNLCVDKLEEQLCCEIVVGFLYNCPVA